MSKVLWVEDQNELEEIIAENYKVVVDFTAPAWCRPCQQFASHFETAAEKSDAVFVAVDVDKAPWAGVEYGVQSVPTVMLFDTGMYEKHLLERSVVRLLGEIA